MKNPDRLTPALLISCAVMLCNVAHAAEDRCCPGPGCPKGSLIIAGAAGSQLDQIARSLAKAMSESTGETLVVENRPGEDGRVAARAAAASGNLFAGTQETAAVAPLFLKSGDNPFADLSPLTQLVTIPSMLVVHPSLPVRSIKDLIALGKDKPGALNFGSTGTGSFSHLAALQFGALTGAGFTHVPYKGTGPLLAALLSGEVQLSFLPTSAVAPHIAAGRLRPLAVTSPKRLGSFPQVPTFSESGLRDYEVQNWVGLFESKKKPPECKKKTKEIIDRSVAAPEFRSLADQTGITVLASSPAEFEATLKAEMSRWARIIKAAGVQRE